MMEDPSRLLSQDGGASALEIELLQSLRNVGPPEGAKARAWEALAAQIGTATLVSASASTAQAATVVTKASAGAGALGAKVVAVVIAGGLAAGGGLWALSPEPYAAPRESVQTTSVEQVQAGGPVQGTPEESTVDAPEAATPPKEEAPKRQAARPSGVRSRDSLLRESALLKQARAQLQSGNVQAAQGTLDMLASEFPNGVLGQEREVLTIAVLSANGQTQRAQQRARAFVKAHPQSPHSAKLQQFLVPP